MLHPPKKGFVTAAIAGCATLLSTSAARAQQAGPPPAWAIEAPARYRNPSMRVTGIVLTSIASAALVAGLVVTAVEVTGNCGDTCVLYYAFAFAPLVGGSTVLAGVGIPLWVVGSQSPADHAALPRWVPTAVPARNGAGLRWTF